MSIQFTFRASKVALTALAAAFCVGSTEAETLLQPRTPAVRGLAGDHWADIELGQRDFTEINEGMIGPNRVKGPAGIAIDRTVSPGRIYIWDSGNNRIIGMDLATCYASSGPCAATLVIGQPSLNDHGGCNLDSSFQTYPNRPAASASTLCGVTEGTQTVLEDKSYGGMYVDAQGNLWVADVRNHRVLKYNTPFVSGTVADAVWGQVDFTGNKCNRQTVYYYHGWNSGMVSPDASSLCFGEVGAGVTLDAQGNLWVADGGNNRVLRFPNLAGTVAKTADIVIGQPDFTSSASGKALNQFNNPSQVRFDPNGNLLVLDSLDGESNSRVLRFRPPFHNGMSGETFYSCPNWDTTLTPPNCGSPPVAIEVDSKRNGIWVVVNEGFHGRPRLYNLDGTLRDDLSELGPDALANPVHGSIGIDANGDLLLATLVYGQDVRRVHENLPGQYVLKRDLFLSSPFTNAFSGSRVQHAAWGGVAVAGKQVIVADGRLLFWNDRTTLTNGQAPSGYVGGSSITDVPIDWAGQLSYGQVKTDKDLHVWVTHSNENTQSSEVLLYQAPLVTGAAPVKSLHTIPVLGGGSITLVSAFGIAATDHSEYLWISEPTRHHVIRVRGPLTANPVVDVILGQTTYSGTEQCNRGLSGQSPTAPINALCFPGAISIDRRGNLFVSDHYIEIRGNRRLLMFAPLPAPATAPILAPAAVKLFPPVDGYEHGTFEPAFDSGNRMTVGINPYSGSRFVHIYSNPTAVNPSNPADPALAHADGELEDFVGWPVGMTFDADDNLYVYDANRMLFIYQKPLGNLQQIKLISPNGGEQWHSDTVNDIIWAALPSIQKIDIDYQPFNTTNWVPVARGALNTGWYPWTVTRMPGNDARVRIADSANPTVNDINDAAFSVLYTFSWVLSPKFVCLNGATPTQGGTSAQFVYANWPPNPLVWNSAPASQNLLVHSSDSQNHIYLSMLTLDGYYDYLTPLFTQVHAALISGTYWSPSTPMIQFSPQNPLGFTPLPQGTYTVSYYAPPRWCPGSAPVQTLKPAAAEVIAGLTNYQVRWVAGSDIGTTVKVEYSTNNGSTWTLINGNVANTGVFSMSIPNTSTTIARIRITSTTKATATGMSPAFTVQAR